MSNERLEKFSVKVGAGASRTGGPTGTVDVELGDRVICRIHLSKGKGDCSLGSERLPPGSYELAAHYCGDSNFTRSTSREEHLTVLAPAQAKLALSRSTVPVSREGDVEFKVEIEAEYSGDSTAGPATSGKKHLETTRG